MRPTHSIQQSEALAWLSAHPAAGRTSVVTSLPDRSELGVSLTDWRAWFVHAARTIIRWVPDDGVSIFYQTDVRHHEIWIDKGQLVASAAEGEAVSLVWHKIVCRRAPGTASPEGRPTYSHLLCLSARRRAPRRPTPDVLATAGPASSFRAMGYAVGQQVCDYLRHETQTERVVDPFCGTGGILAVASIAGFDVIGIDRSAKYCRAARATLARVRAMHEAVQRGAELFDRGAYFAAHEAWEERWRVASDHDERRGLQGLIQVAAAFHKYFVSRSPESALRLLGRALDKLDATEWMPGFDVVAFRGALHGCAAELASGSLELAGVPCVVARRADNRY